MASAAATVDDEETKMDAVEAFKIYDREIAPKLGNIAEKRGELSEPWERIKETCNFPKKVMMFISQISEMEDYKRDHFLQALHEGMKAKKLYLPSDLVSMANGAEPDEAVIPISKGSKAKLATIGGGE